MDADEARREQEREKLRQEMEERELRIAREEAEALREFELWNVRRNEELRIRKEDYRRMEHQRALDERSEIDLQKELAKVELASTMSGANNQARPTSRSGRETQTLFSFFKSMKGKYDIKPINYFCDLLTKVPPAGEITRFFEYFKEDMTKTGVTYQKFPILYYTKIETKSDRDILSRFIDAQDEDGFTALHWAVFQGNLSLTEELLKLGASTEIRTFINKHSPIDKIPHGHTQMHELFRKYRDINKALITPDQVTSTPLRKLISDADSSRFPFLELPTELQFFILEQLSIGTMMTVRCVCKYFKELQLSNNHVTALPDMGKWHFLDPPEDGYFRDKRCTLTIMATPTVFHFGMITGHLYQPPSYTTFATVTALFARIEKFAVEDGKWRYDLKKLKEFLDSMSYQKTYVLAADLYWSRQAIFIELDPSFGIGIEFRSPGDPDPRYYDDDY